VRGSRGYSRNCTTYSTTLKNVRMGLGSGQDKGGYPRVLKTGGGDERFAFMAKMVPPFESYYSVSLS
jgi:hypothetical protein